MEAQIISFRCVLKNKLGKVLSESVNHEVLNIGGVAGIPLKGLTDGLQNIKEGEQRRISLSAAQAYGFYDLEKLKKVSRDSLPEDLRLRESIRIEGDSTLYKVIEMNEDFVTLDSNHPLAGQDLIFEVEATRVRVATAEEVQQFDETSEIPTYH
jgi:FKBP-type peptidyl-prolyl cis-trans isomerase SlyD